MPRQLLVQYAAHLDVLAAQVGAVAFIVQQRTDLRRDALDRAAGLPASGGPLRDEQPGD